MGSSMGTLCRGWFFRIFLASIFHRRSTSMNKHKDSCGSMGRRRMGKLRIQVAILKKKMKFYISAGDFKTK